MKKRAIKFLLLVLLVFGGNLATTGASSVSAAGGRPIAVDQAGLVAPSSMQGSSYLVIVATGPIDLFITDPQGRRVGVDPVSGQVVQEIPGVYYYGPLEVFEGLETEGLSIPDPLSGTYSIRATGTGENWFNLVAMVGTSWQGELLLHDTGNISLDQMIEYTVSGEPLPLSERAVTYILPLLETGEWESVLHLQSPGQIPDRVMVTVYDSMGTEDLFASLDRTIASQGALSMVEILFLRRDFYGSATAESRGGQRTALIQTAEAADLRRMATEGIVGNTGVLYVPYVSAAQLSSTLYLENVGGEPADVRVTYYEEDGTIVPGSPLTLTLSSRAMTWLTSDAGLPEGFQGSAVLESLNGQPLVGAVFLGDLAGQAALYSVADRPAAALFVPQVLKGSAGLTTTLQIQNTAAATTTVAVRYYDTAGQPLAAAETRLTLPPHGAAPVALADNAALSAGFADAAILQSLDGAPLTAVALVQGGPGSDTLGATSALYGGSALLALPYLDTTTGQTPAVQIQNLGSAATTVTLRCFDAGGTPAYSTTTMVAPYGYATFVTATLPLTPGVYAAVLESGSDQPLAAFVLQQGIPSGLSLYGGSAAGAFVVPPVSFAAAPAATRTASFSVTLTTNAPPAEIVSTTLWVRTPLTTTWATSGLVLTTTSGALAYTPTAGDGTYSFAAVARDAAGYREAEPAGPGDSATLYDTTAPASIATAPAYANGAAITVTFAAADAGIGVAETTLWVRTPLTTTWATTALVLTGTSGTFAYTPTTGDGTYFFGTVAEDWAGNREAAPSGAGDDSTVYDATPPASQVDALLTYSPAVFTVTWSGSDATSGLLDYDLQVCAVDCFSGGWSDWLTHTTATTHAFTGSHGVTYSFRSRARDVAGNAEPWPTSADTATTIDTEPPETAVETMPAYYTTTTFPVQWNGSDALSGLHHYDLYYRAESAANWTLWLKNVTYTQTTFSGARGYTYHFCSQGVDNLGNAENCPPSSTGTGWPIQSDAHTGVTPWSRVNDLPAENEGQVVHVSWSSAPGTQVVYDVQVRDGFYGMWLPWKSGVTYTSADFVGQYGHIYCFRSRQRASGIWELYPLNYDTYTKLINPTLGGSLPPGSPLTIPPDEAPDRMEEVTRTQALGTLTGYIAPADDVDWYRFELTATKRLRVTLADLPADFDVYVFDGSGQFLWASTWGHQLPEEIVVRVPAGVYCVQLVGYAGAWSGEEPYRLTVERVGGGGGQGGAAGGLGAPEGAPRPW